MDVPLNRMQVASATGMALCLQVLYRPLFTSPQIADKQLVTPLKFSLLPCEPVAH